MDVTTIVSFQAHTHTHTHTHIHTHTYTLRPSSVDMTTFVAFQAHIHTHTHARTHTHTHTHLCGRDYHRLLSGSQGRMDRGTRFKHAQSPYYPPTTTRHLPLRASGHLDAGGSDTLRTPFCDGYIVLSLHHKSCSRGVRRPWCFFFNFTNSSL